MLSIKSFGSGSMGNSYQVTDGSCSLIIDAGVPLKTLKRKGLGHIDTISGVLVSHRHGDHCLYISDYLKLGVPCYMNADTIDFLKVGTHHWVHKLEPKQVIDIGPFRVLPFPLEHDVPNYGFLIQSGTEKLVYITDSYYCHYKFNGLTHIMVEANYSFEILNANVREGRINNQFRDRLIKSHFALENTLKFLAANDLQYVQEIHLLHLSDRNSDAELFKNKVAAATGKVVYIAE